MTKNLKLAALRSLVATNLDRFRISVHINCQPKRVITLVLSYRCIENVISVSRYIGQAIYRLPYVHMCIYVYITLQRECGHFYLQWNVQNSGSTPRTSYRCSRPHGSGYVWTKNLKFNYLSLTKTSKPP